MAIDTVTTWSCDKSGCARSTTDREEILYSDRGWRIVEVSLIAVRGDGNIAAGTTKLEMLYCPEHAGELDPEHEPPVEPTERVEKVYMGMPSPMQTCAVCNVQFFSLTDARRCANCAGNYLE